MIHFSVDLIHHFLLNEDVLVDPFDDVEDVLFTFIGQDFDFSGLTKIFFCFLFFSAFIILNDFLSLDIVESSF